MTSLRFVVDLSVINDMLFVQRRWGDEHSEIVTTTRSDFPLGDYVKLRDGRVIDNDFAVIPASPFSSKDVSSQRS